MMLLWASAGVPLGVYNTTVKFNIALRIQAQILTFLSLLTWSQCYYYGKKWSIFRCASTLVGMCILMGGVEARLIFALKVSLWQQLEAFNTRDKMMSTNDHELLSSSQAGIDRHITWPVTLIAILAAVLLAVGVLRHYCDIYIHRTVRGISFIFVGIDAAGDLFSLISVCKISPGNHPPVQYHGLSLPDGVDCSRDGHLWYGARSLDRRVHLRRILQSDALG